MQRQIHRHARHNRAQHGLPAAFAPKKPGRAGSHRKQPGILPCADEMPLRHHRLGHDDCSERGNRCIVQPALGPAWQFPRLAGNVEEGARQYRDGCQADDHGQTPDFRAVHQISSVSIGLDLSSVRQTTTATAMATTILSWNGRAKATTAADPATAADSRNSRFEISEHRMPNKARMPAKPRPQLTGTKLASTTPS